METIEIGAVMVENKTFAVIDEFQTFIRPVRNPVLTEFCKELTTISQSDVEAASTYPEAIVPFKQWLYQYSNFAFCSWGDYDKSQLQADSDYHQVANPIGASHFNVKREFSAAMGLKKKFGMAQALEHVGIDLVGTHHRGIDDARNIAKLMPFIVPPLS